MPEFYDLKFPLFKNFWTSKMTLINNILNVILYILVFDSY